MRSRTTAVVLLLVLGFLAAPFSVDAQQAKKLPLIAYLTIAPSGQVEALKLGLRELGYLEGRNITIEYRYYERFDRLPDVAAEVVRLKPDVIFAPATASTKAAREASGTIPIVFAGVADPVGAGFAASLARPGGNVTGLSAINVELTAKRLELLREAAPGITRVALLLDPADPIVAPVLKEAEVGARALGLKVQPVELRSAADFDGAFAAMARARTGVLLTGGWLFRHQARIAELAMKHRLPVIGDSRNYAEAGTLLGYGASYEDLARRAAAYIDKILKGAKAGDLPIERPTRFDLVINLKTAKAIGLTLPQSLLVRADQVIQ